MMVTDYISVVLSDAKFGHTIEPERAQALVDAFAQILATLVPVTSPQVWDDRMAGAEVFMSEDKRVRLVEYYKIKTDTFGYRLDVAR